MERHVIVNFIDFLLRRVFQSKSIPETIVIEAWKDVIKDVNYHFPSMRNLF